MTDDERVPVTVHLKPRGLAAVDWLAEQDGVDRPEEVRRLLTEAVMARKRLIAARQIDARHNTPQPKKGRPAPAV